MKTFTILTALLFLSTFWTTPVMADPQCQPTIDMSSASVSGTWTQSDKLVNLRNVQSIFIVNTSTDREILVNCSGGSTAPSDTSKNNIPVGGPASDSTWALDGVNGGSSCWYKANGGTISSGYFKLCVSGN